MSRWKAAGIHLAMSVIIGLLIASLIYFIWYPQPYFQLSGGNSLILLIMSVDVTLGPLLTLFVFKAGKKSLRFDLTVILLLQIVAFGYGLSVIAAARPVFIVGLLDQFVVVSAYQVDSSDLAQGSGPEFNTLSWTGPRLVGAVLPTSPDERAHLGFSGAAGKDADKFPKYYVPFAQIAKSLAAKGQPLQKLQGKSAQAAAEIDKFISAHGGDISQYVYLPLRGRLEAFAMVLPKTNHLQAQALPIDPW